MTVIKVENLSKKYLIQHQQKEKYLALRDVLTEGALNIAQQGSTLLQVVARRKHFSDLVRRSPSTEDFWALKDIDFTISEGDRLGIIGRNGAGKSTLLKILSRITEPTTGRVSIKGKVSSLLEVGTGFHPELTGRENIYLNGAILGMSKKELDRKFDEIVDFAEVARFLDTPVKRYSSGMHVRLAFAVAAHLEPDILIVDEVLAVGDVQFQKKCIGKMENVAQEGRTVIFVSHNMEAIQRLCRRSILLDEGKIVKQGDTAEVVNDYLQLGPGVIGEKVWDDIDKAPGDNVVRLHAVRLKDKDGNIATSFDVCDPVAIEIGYWVLQDNHMLDAEIILKDISGHMILYSPDNKDSPWSGESRTAGLYWSTCQIPGDFLNEGQVFVTVGVSNNPYTCHALAKDVLNFDVKDTFDPGGVRGNFCGTWPTCPVRPRLPWKVERQPLKNRSE